ncbi:hypothetical protein SAMN04490248_11144 [Salinihabitans flavidus]|uniref:Uncharacterized protein n=1 Tax=Salinihabitans flavidus TaxID=569882 RepID=A0A1H8S9S6_9RHOB|nr:hypothetical protein [Salinihabitans flavidus]SEO74923.1 hypothetical protein SAMN04490248_11144 [Salinihabitans flavidus]
MTEGQDILTVPEADHGRLRVFALDLPEAEYARLKDPEPDQPPTAAAVAEMLSLDWLDPDHIELFDTADLEGLGLPAYLTEGAGVSEEGIAPDRARLDAHTGPVLILHSGAFGGKPATLRPARALTPLGYYDVGGPPVHYAPLPAKGARDTPTAPQPDAPPPVNPHRMLLWALLALPLAALVLGLLLLWGLS